MTFDEKKSNSRWNETNRIILLVFTFISVALRLYKISEPREVVFDEVHFGGFASHYLKGTYFFDVHPPLGKLIIAGIGHIFGYKGTFDFKAIGDSYDVTPPVPYVEMRTAMATFGIGSIIFAMATIVEMGFSHYALILAGTLLCLDNALITQSRYIFLDTMMFFFIFGSVYFWTKFRQLRYQPFSLKWWAFLGLTGIYLAGSIGVKMVGLFTVALIGIACFYDLWELSDWKRQMSDKNLIKHFFARFLLLACIPMTIYLSFYYLHFKLLPLSGPGDKYMTIDFQKSLLGNKLHSDARPIYYGQTFRIQNAAEKIYLHSHDDRIPLRHLDGKVSSNGQQINGYPEPDENNLWTIKLVKAYEKDEAEDSKEESPQSETKSSETENDKSTNGGVESDGAADNNGRVPIRFGDLVQICHIATEKCMLTHDVASPLTKTNTEITMYEIGRNDKEEYTHWVLESDENLSKGVPLRSLGRFRIFNKNFNVRIINHGKNLPAWGFNQRELNGSKKEDYNGNHFYSWTVSEVLEPRTAEEEAEREKALKETKPLKFLVKFVELQLLSLLINNTLVDDHPFKSRPHQWPLPLKGFLFWNKGTKARIFLMGNVVAWTLGILGVFVFAVRFTKDKFLEHRGLVKFHQDRYFQRFGNKMVYLFGAYLLHYLPFYLLTRSLYLHHYLPSYMFSVLIAAGQFDYMTRNYNPKIRAAFVALVLIGTVWGLVYLWPLVYGTQIEAELLNKRKLFKSWNF